MRFLPVQQPLGAAALLAAAPGIAGKGGPTPDPLFGWEGVTSPSGGVRYVALADWKQIDDGRRDPRRGRPRDRLGELQGHARGSPRSRWDGTKDGLSADGRRLVLASYSSRAVRPAHDVPRPRREDAASRVRRIELPGHWAFDALSPNGTTIYALQYGAPGSGHYERARDRRRHAATSCPGRSSTSASPTRRCSARR